MLTKGQGYFRYWRWAMYLCNMCCSIPYRWDAKAEKVQLVGKRSYNIYQVLLFIHVTYTGVMGIHIYLNYEAMSLADCLKGLVVIFAYATTAISRITFWYWENDGKKMINAFLVFEKNLLKNFPEMDPKFRKASIITRIIFAAGTVSTLLFGCCIFILLLVEPCTPPYIGSMREVCLIQGKGGVAFQVKMSDPLTLAIITFDGLMWFHVAQPAALALGNIMLGFGLCLKKYLRVIAMECTKIIQNSCGPIEDHEEDLLSIYSYYSQLQLLVIQMNVTFQNFFIPASLAVCSNALIFSLYICIKLNNVIPMPGFAFFPMILMDALLIIGVDFASAGFVYLESTSVVGNWTRMDGLKKRKKSRLVAKAKSFSLLKIKFGMNFVDELTSLTILDHCLNQTVSLLLMS